MKPTNYHLFDFLDFDPDLSRDESLWKAYKPTSVYEKDGDICINVPFQKQVLSNDMAPDTAFPREEYTLVIRQYTSGITRLFIGFGEESMTDQSEMLQFSDRVKKLPLQSDTNRRGMVDHDPRRNPTGTYPCKAPGTGPLERTAARSSRDLGSSPLPRRQT